MKINWNTVSSVTAALCGLVMITIIPVAQSWINLKFENQSQKIEANASAKFETMAQHDADIAKIASATDRLQQKAVETDLTVQHLRDVVANKQTTKKGTDGYDN